MVAVARYRVRYMCFHMDVVKVTTWIVSTVFGLLVIEDAYKIIWFDDPPCSFDAVLFIRHPGGPGRGYSVTLRGPLVIRMVFAKT